MLNLKQKGFYKGVNLGGWFSQCDYSAERMNQFITEQDFQKIASWGADHVRIPVDYNVLELEDGFSRIDEAIRMGQKYGLNTVLDLHKTAGFSFDTYGENEHGFFDDASYQEQFYQLWERFAERYASQPVAFELLNEVTDKEFLPAWNRIATICIQRIRKLAPENLILVGSYENNSAKTVQYLDIPDDENLVYNMHCYEPLKFTHQGAYWTEAINPEQRFPFAESNITPEYFENLFASAINKAEKHHTVLYCGEYGVIDRVSPEDTLAWFKTIHDVFEKHHIARCAWNYKQMDFGLSDDRLHSVRKEILKNL
ncbi:MAG: cellulase family glycosylhydrolase [Oscillospiraceae bacterium]|nr:cellulase family glycosylhydrolase [Oscillospiraceae bacterium]